MRANKKEGRRVPHYKAIEAHRNEGDEYLKKLLSLDPRFVVWYRRPVFLGDNKSVYVNIPSRVAQELWLRTGSRVKISYDKLNRKIIIERYENEN